MVLLPTTCQSLPGKFFSLSNGPTCTPSVHLRGASMHLLSMYYVPGTVRVASQDLVSRHHCNSISGN